MIDEKVQRDLLDILLRKDNIVFFEPDDRDIDKLDLLSNDGKPRLVGFAVAEVAQGPHEFLKMWRIRRDWSIEKGDLKVGESLTRLCMLLEQAGSNSGVISLSFATGRYGYYMLIDRVDKIILWSYTLPDMPFDLRPPACLVEFQRHG